MKRKILILLAVLLAAGTPLTPTASAIEVSISIGDRPYYYGPNYWHQGYRWVWIPGYRYRGRWIHGHYERRGRYYLAHSRANYRYHRHYNRNRDRYRQYYDHDDDRDNGRGRGRNRDRD